MWTEVGVLLVLAVAFGLAAGAWRQVWMFAFYGRPAKQAFARLLCTFVLSVALWQVLRVSNFGS